MHEIPLDVHLQHIARFAIVLALLPDMALQPANAIVCAALLDATVGVSNECALQHFMDIVVIKVVHDAVAELSGKDLPPLGVGDDKASGRARRVCSVPKFIAEFP